MEKEKFLISDSLMLFVSLVGIFLFSYIAFNAHTVLDLEEKGIVFCEEHGGLMRIAVGLTEEYVYCNEIEEKGTWFFGLLSYKHHYTGAYEKDGEVIKEKIGNTLNWIVPLVVLFVIGRTFEKNHKSRQKSKQTKRGKK